MSWVPNIPQSLELRRSCANLTMSGPLSFSPSSHAPYVPHTGRHGDHRRQSCRCILTRGLQNRQISFGTHGEVLTHWTFDRNIFQSIARMDKWLTYEIICQSLVHSRNALEKGRGLIVVSLYHHQLLVWPTLIHKALPQLRVESCPRCRSGGHYRDSATNFSNRLSQLLQTNAINRF